MKDSKAVQGRISELYAEMATAAAGQVITGIKINGPSDTATRHAEYVERWLRKAGAHAARNTFRIRT